MNRQKIELQKRRGRCRNKQWMKWNTKVGKLDGKKEMKQWRASKEMKM